MSTHTIVKPKSLSTCDRCGNTAEHDRRSIPETWDRLSMGPPPYPRLRGDMCEVCVAKFQQWWADGLNAGLPSLE